MIKKHNTMLEKAPNTVLPISDTYLILAEFVTLKDFLCLRLMDKRTKKNLDTVLISSPFFKIYLQPESKIEISDIIQHLQSSGTKPNHPLLALYGASQLPQQNNVNAQLFQSVQEKINVIFYTLKLDTALEFVRSSTKLTMTQLINSLFTYYPEARDKYYDELCSNSSERDCISKLKQAQGVNDLFFNIIIRRPDLAEEVLNEYHDQLDGECLAEIVRAKTELAEAVLDKHHDKLYEECLVEIVRAKKELAEAVLDKCSDDQLSGYLLANIIITKPELFERVFDQYNHKFDAGVPCDDHSDPFKFNDGLSEIVRNKPELAEKVLNKCHDQLDGKCLSEIVRAKPELAEEVLDKHHDKLYGERLAEIVRIKPDLVEDVFDKYHDKLDEICLAEIVRIKPDLAEEVFDKHHDKLDGYLLASIVVKRPDLAEQVFDKHHDKLNGYLLASIVVDRPELAEKIFAKYSYHTISQDFFLLEYYYVMQMKDSHIEVAGSDVLSSEG